MKEFTAEASNTELREIVESLRRQGLSRRNIVRTLQLAELTGEEPDIIVNRYIALEVAVNEILP